MPAAVVGGQSLTLRTADLVGLDTLVHVANNSYEALKDDEERDVFKVPAYVNTMVENKQLGNKTKGGFYKKTREGIQTLDLESLELERIHLRSRFVRASCRATELLTATGRPEQAIEIAQPALEIDRWHEATYLALADAYTAIGDHTSARAVRDRAEVNLGVELSR